MNKKKAIKIATASVLAASTFAAVAPFTTEAAVNLDAVVNNAVSVALQAHQAYTVPAKTGTLVDWHTVQSKVIVAKSTYSSAVATVNKLAGSKKAYYLGKLASAAKYISYAQGYITAIDTAQKLHLEANHLGASTTVDAANAAYVNFPADITSAQTKVTSITADTLTKNLIVKTFFGYPQSLTTIIPAVVAANTSLKAAEDALAKNDTTTAKTNLDAYTAQLKNFDASGSNIVKVVKAYQVTVQAKYDAATATAAVTSVSAVNGKQLLVKFNKAVDTTSAQLAGSYTLTGTTKTVSNATVQADGQSVLLTLSASVSNTTPETFGVTVNGVALKSDSSTTFPIFTSTVTVSDTTAPTVASVTSVTNGSTATSATVTFSEPVSSGYIIFDGGVTKYAVTAGSTTTTISGNGLALDSSKSHTIEVVNLKDGSGNATADASSSFTVTKDAVVPVISNVSAYNDNKILVTFSKKVPVDGNGNLADVNGTAIPTTNFAVKDETLTTLNSVASIKALASDTTGTQFVVDFGGNSTLYTNSNTRNLQLVVTGTGITDTLGNALTSVVKPVTLTKDTVAPSVTNVTVQKTNGLATSITLNYSEPVNATTAAVSIVNASGVLLPAVTGTIGADGKSIVVPVTGTGNVSVSVNPGFVTDTSVSLNPSAAYSTNVDLGTPAASVSKFDITATPVVSGKVITVTFPTAVKGGNSSDSATNLSNYTLGGKALPAGTTITLNPVNQPSAGTVAQTIATITLPAGSIAADTQAAVFTINAGIAGLDGSISNAVTKTLTINDNTAPVLQSARLVSTTGTSTVIELTYNEAMNQALVANNVLDELQFTDNGTVVGTAATAGTVSGYTNKVLVTLTTTGTVKTTDTITVKTIAATVADLVDNSLGANAETTGTTVTVQ
ncbi:MAG: hypothetical protein Q8934_18275 [Bacillota bacterium]|nr:hypothetical protein [Bacillota bacterium]